MLRSSAWGGQALRPRTLGRSGCSSLLRVPVGDGIFPSRDTAATCKW